MITTTTEIKIASFVRGYLKQLKRIKHDPHEKLRLKSRSSEGSEIHA